MMPVIELPEGKACLILLLADLLPEGEAAQNFRLGSPVSWTHQSSSDNMTIHFFWK
jgi:hypothetical protein